MAISREHRSLAGAASCRVEARAARGRTSPAVGDPRPPGVTATVAPRAARRCAGAALLCLAAALAGCEPYVQGNGVYGEEGREGLGPFTGVVVDSGVEATVTAGAAAASVVVSGDSNVVPRMTTEVRTDGGGRRVLRVRIATAYGGSIPPRATIALPTLEYAGATGASRLSGLRLGARHLEVEAEDRSAVVLEGAASPAGETMEVKLGSGATLDATAYALSGAAEVALSGGSAARLRADGPVSGTVTGASTLDATAGAGSCAGVTADASSTVVCR